MPLKAADSRLCLGAGSGIVDSEVHCYDTISSVGCFVLRDNILRRRVVFALPYEIIAGCFVEICVDRLWNNGQRERYY